jgi:hypothetical protein
MEKNCFQDEGNAFEADGAVNAAGNLFGHSPAVSIKLEALPVIRMKNKALSS